MNQNNPDFIRDLPPDNDYRDYREDDRVDLSDIAIATKILDREGTYKDRIAELRLTRDLKNAAQILERNEVRYLVDMYYGMQNQRIRADAQVRASITAEKPEPNELVAYLATVYSKLEDDMKAALQRYVESSLLGRWLMSIMGIGPVIAAGLLCHVDVTVAKTSGDVWRYSGYDPTSKWLGQEKARKAVSDVAGAATKLNKEEIELICNATARKFELFAKACKFDEELNLAKRGDVVSALSKRPWNASMKRLGYLAGESFIKTKSRLGSYYGPLYDQRKAYENEKNLRFEYADQAAYALETKNFGADTEARKYYEKGLLPPAHIQSRVRRWVVRIFLSHYFQVAYEIEFHQEMPKPWILESQPERHTHFYAPPNWPFEGFERDFVRTFS